MTANRPQPVALPPLWVALALGIWGALTHNLAGAVAMALLLEGFGRAPVKWTIAERDFHRAADVTSLIFALVTVAQFARYSVHGIYQILTVSPYCLFPLVLIQRASTAQTLPLSALFYSLRRQPELNERIDILPQYLALNLLAASTGNQHGGYYLGACLVVVIGVLVRSRPRRYGWPAWTLALLLAGTLGWLMQQGVFGVQRWLESSFTYWVNQFPWLLNDPNRAVTAIGTIGRLKLSDQIRVRVTPHPHMSLPLRLQEASYDSFNFGTWTATHADFAALDKRAHEQAWDTAAAGGAGPQPFEITVQHAGALVLLPAPRGTYAIASPEIAELQHNRLGTVMAEAPPGALRFRALAAQTPSNEPAPSASDSAVPKQYQELLKTITNEIGTTATTDAGRATQIRQFFLDHFKYSLIQQDSAAWKTPLADFLQHSRRGHCEYFATATVLLLRQAGIPARYAVGYMVENYSELEHAYIARARHAHAWALAWFDGSWQVIDATPSEWSELEDERASRWQYAQDLVGWLWYRYQRLDQADFSDWSARLPWLVPPLALILYLRLRKSPTAVRTAATGVAGPLSTAGNPMLAALFARLAAAGLQPLPGETAARFLARAAPLTSGGVSCSDLIRDYYHQRFRPRTVGDGAVLQAAVARFCAGLDYADPQPPELASASRKSRRSSVDSI